MMQLMNCFRLYHPFTLSLRKKSFIIIERLQSIRFVHSNETLQYTYSSNDSLGFLFALSANFQIRKSVLLFRSFNSTSLLMISINLEISFGMFHALNQLVNNPVKLDSNIFIEKKAASLSF